MPARITVRLDVLTEPVDGECPTCLFDALRRTHGYSLSPTGVTQVFDVLYCARCRAEEKRTA